MFSVGKFVEVITKLTTCCCLVALARGDIITLSKKQEINCVVTGNSKDSAIYIHPPVKSEFNLSISELNNWEYDDWSTSASSKLQTPVTDQRWTDFRLLNGNDGYHLTNGSLSVSVCTTDKIIFTVYDENFIKEKSITFRTDYDEEDESCKWFHYTLLTENNTISSSGDEIIGIYELDFEPSWIYAKNPNSNDTFWKIHELNFKTANSITQTQKSSLIFPLLDNLCVSMYVAVGTDSSLDITLESNGTKVQKTVTGFAESEKKWQKLEIQALSAGMARLSFFRRQEQEGIVDGYWAIDDIKLCTQDLEIYRTLLEEGEADAHVCRVLDESDRVLDESDSLWDDSLPCDEAGYLGENCNITCAMALGASHPYCEQYTICQGVDCFCSWGYQGYSCEQTCEQGAWGLFCYNECPLLCERCNSSTGECLEKTLQEEEFPPAISMCSSNIFVYLPDRDIVPGNTTYQFKYLCASQWCQNEIVYENTYSMGSSFVASDIIVQIYEDFLPFTEYQPVVTAIRDAQSRTKIYPIITPDPDVEEDDPSDISNLTAYYISHTSVWLKFVVPDSSNFDISSITVWYQQYDSIAPPNRVGYIFQCESGSDFFCVNIDGLNDDTTYSMAVVATDPRSQSRQIFSTLFVSTFLLHSPTTEIYQAIVLSLALISMFALIAVTVLLIYKLKNRGITYQTLK